MAVCVVDTLIDSERVFVADVVPDADAVDVALVLQVSLERDTVRLGRVRDAVTDAVSVENDCVPTVREPVCVAVADSVGLVTVAEALSDVAV